MLDLSRKLKLVQWDMASSWIFGDIRIRKLTPRIVYSGLIEEKATQNIIYSESWRFPASFIIFWSYFSHLKTKSLGHKVHIYLEFHSVCPHIRIETPPSPLPKRVYTTTAPPPNQRGTNSPVGKGGGSQFGRLKKKPGTLSTQWFGEQQLHILFTMRCL